MLFGAGMGVGLFVVMQKYPLGMILSLVSLVLLCTFFITSANSGTFVLSMLTSSGNLNPPNNQGPIVKAHPVHVVWNKFGNGAF